MTVNSHLTALSNFAIVRDRERDCIQRSLATLQDRLNRHFGTNISNQFVFGSYSRNTILPRSMDTNSDVDYMIVLTDSSARPQTYLNRLRRFVEAYYSRSEIFQSNPTIVLSLNHIKFELVPAINDWFSGLKIPAKTSAYEDWISTDPTGFNQQLTSANQAHRNLIKPLIRIMKYWNARNRYPFDSYELEQDIVQHDFGLFGLFMPKQLKDYFYDYAGQVNVGWSAPQWKKDAVVRLRRVIEEAKQLEGDGYLETAEKRIKQLLPMPGLLGGVL